MSDTDRIEKQITLKAPIARVWKALTDAAEFGAWFRVALDGPFVVGGKSHGHVTYAGYEHLQWAVEVKEMTLPVFSFYWHPYAIDPAVDYAAEPPTLVEFRLAEVAGGTRLTVTESGFDALPASRRDEAFRMNAGGWATQMTNIESHLASQ